MSGFHTVEKIGGTSMTRFGDVMKNVIISFGIGKSTTIRASMEINIILCIVIGDIVALKSMRNPIPLTFPI